MCDGTVVPRGGARAARRCERPHVGVSGKQVPWCFASAGCPAQARPPSGVLYGGRPRPPDGVGGRDSSSEREATVHCHHAGQLGQGRVPRAHASYAGALSADLAAQPHHLLYEGLRLPRGPARDPRERYGPHPVLAAPWGPLRSSEFPAPWPILDTRPHRRLRPRDYPRCNLGPSPGDLRAPSPFWSPHCTPELASRDAHLLHQVPSVLSAPRRLGGPSVHPWSPTSPKY